jgi:dehydrogenase/reductase SDR family protein 7B
MTASSASKHALQGYSDGLRAELARNNISVTTISPGYVKTSLSLNALNPDGSRYNKMDDTTASGMEPEVLADKILFSLAKGEADVLIADAKTHAAVLMRATMPEAFAWVMKKRAQS